MGNIRYINIGPYVLSMAFIILSPTFSLFVTNIRKLCLVIYTLAWLHGMPLLLLNQFLACSGVPECCLENISSIYFDTVGWCLNFGDVSIYCCAFSHWGCILCLSAIVIMQKICPLASLF